MPIKRNPGLPLYEYKLRTLYSFSLTYNIKYRLNGVEIYIVLVHCSTIGYICASMRFRPALNLDNRCGWCISSSFGPRIKCSLHLTYGRTLLFSPLPLSPSLQFPFIRYLTANTFETKNMQIDPLRL